jgi:tetratricopeptide (TPR) repeat protein
VADRIEQLKSLLAADPGDAFCLYGLAMEYSKAHQFDLALQHFDLTLIADPDYCYAYFHKAKCQEQAGDRAGAMATLRQGLVRARIASDMKAMSEIGAYLDELEP